MCSTPAQFVGLFIAAISTLAMVAMVICWVIGKRAKVRWRLLSALGLAVGVVMLFLGA